MTGRACRRILACVGKRGFTPAPNHEETAMKSNSLIGLLALAGFSLSPAWAQHEGHQHGQSEATPASREAGEASGKAADKPTPNDLKAGGKTCKKCGKSMGGGGHDHGAARTDDDHAATGAEVEALRARVHQLEKRLDLMQTLVEMLSDRARKGGQASHH